MSAPTTVKIIDVRVLDAQQVFGFPALACTRDFRDPLDHSDAGLATRAESGKGKQQEKSDQGKYMLQRLCVMAAVF